MDAIPAIKRIHEQTRFLVQTGKVDRSFTQSSAAVDPKSLKFYFESSNGRNKRVGRILNGNIHSLFLYSIKNLVILIELRNFETNLSFSSCSQ